jgi:FkbM family methyltransferase
VLGLLLWSLNGGGLGGSSETELYGGKGGKHHKGGVAARLGSSGGGGGGGGSSGGGGGSSGGAAVACVVSKPTGHVNRPVSIEWTGRQSERIQYGWADKSTLVYKNDFPGSTLWLDFWNRVNRGQWEHETLWIIEYFLSPERHPGAVYVDFGSWIGPTVLYAGQFAEKVYSLEPDPLSFSTLNANINLNPLVAAKVSLYHECIAPKAGVLEMAGSGESNTRLTGTLDEKFLKAGTRWKVNCRTLPQFLDEEKVDISNLRLIKMDTEGTELWLLPSLRPWLEGLGEGKKPAIWLSVHSPFWKEQETEEHKNKVKIAWDVLGLFKYVYDQDLKLIDTKSMAADLCPDFCTFLLSDEREWGKGGRDNFRKEREIVRTQSTAEITKGFTITHFSRFI